MTAEQFNDLVRSDIKRMTRYGRLFHWVFEHDPASGFSADRVNYGPIDTTASSWIVPGTIEEEEPEEDEPKEDEPPEYKYEDRYDNFDRSFHWVFEHDAWKTRTDWDEEARFYPGPSNDQIKRKLEQLTHDIEWLTTRLANLSLSDEDFDQTQDYIFELRQERESLKRCFNV